EDRHAERDFVADDLGAGPERAKEAVLVVRRVAAQDDAVDGEAAYGEDEENADVHAWGDDELVFTRTARREAGWSKRHDGKGQRRGADGDSGGEQEQELVNVAGDDLFLEEEFQAVGDRLEQAKGADAVGADAVLHVGGELALDVDQVGAGPLDDA